MRHDDTAKTKEERARDATAMLERALKEPGVREMMSVYKQWESIETTIQPYCRVTTPKMIVALADTSDPSALCPA
jgi:hypothetical protein